MTREEARREIDSLDFYLQNHTDDYSEESHAAMMMAIKVLEQEHCEDAVSRQAVHDMLENLPITAENKWFNWLQKACMRLAELPPVTPTKRWIPVSEKLPENMELVLCSSKRGGVFEGRYFDDETDYQWYTFRNDEFVQNDVIDAWMPLPEPYKAESEGEE